MQKNLLLLSAFFVMLFAMGCISVEVYHKQNADGSAVLTQKINMSKYFDLMVSKYGVDSKNVTAEFQKVCDDAPPGVSCTADPDTKVVSMQKTYTQDNAFYKFETSGDLFGKKYKLTIDELPSFSSKASQISTPTRLTTADPEFIQNLSTFGITWTYVIEMPGKITKAEGGTIDPQKPNVVRFDLVERISKKKEIIVEAESSKLFCLPSLIFLMLLVGFVINKLRQS